MKSHFTFSNFGATSVKIIVGLSIATDANLDKYCIKNAVDI